MIAATPGTDSRCSGIANSRTRGLTPTSHRALHDALRAHFTEREVAEIAAVIINMTVWTRLKLAQGAIPEIQV